MEHLILKEADTNKELGKIAKIYRGLVSEIVDNDKVIIKQPIGTIKYPGVDKGLHVASPSDRKTSSQCSGCSREKYTRKLHIGPGDPLYAVGGQPQCFDYNVPDKIFAEDGGYPKPTQPVPGDCGYHLHAHQLVISHPMTSEVIEIIAPVPTILQTERGQGVRRLVEPK